MPKCETPAQIVKRNGEECDRCFRERYSSEEELKRIQCQHCKYLHLKKHMSEKLIGHLCESCAAEYEKEVMEMLIAKYAQPAPSA